ncbi:MAG: hypothetical protein E7367_01150 [Clostridiales bacterium]|nr:hypothetical protein [Clostridiales bacterium]
MEKLKFCRSGVLPAKCKQDKAREHFCGERTAVRDRRARKLDKVSRRHEKAYPKRGFAYKMQARQGARAFLRGAYIDVRDPRKRGAQRCIAPHFAGKKSPRIATGTTFFLFSCERFSLLFSPVLCDG